jgi:hypothetical protein
MEIYLAISVIISAIVSIVVALVSLGWLFRDGEDSTRSLQEFTNDGTDFGRITTKFGIWLVIAVGAGCLCFFCVVSGWAMVAFTFTLVFCGFRLLFSPHFG